MEPIYTDKYDGSRRIDYGAKFSSVAVIKISVIKSNGKDFTVAEVRDFLKWTTGSRTNSYLDLVVGDKVKFSFLGRVTNAYQQKLDSRTIGLSIEFTSVSPWAYSPIQYAEYRSSQSMVVDDDGVLYLNDSNIIQIDNKTDDLYTPVYLNVLFENATSNTLTITNTTLNEETKITSVSKNEVITLSSEQFILSDDTSKIFGDSFNYMWPRLGPGINELVIDMDGVGNVSFTYRYPIKIGDCAGDIDALNNMCGDYYEDDDDDSSNGNNSSIGGTVSWLNIVGKPTSLYGYGITNAYTKNEVDDMIADVEYNCDENANVDEDELNNMLNDIFK